MLCELQCCAVLQRCQHHQSRLAGPALCLPAVQAAKQLSDHHAELAAEAADEKMFMQHQQVWYQECDALLGVLHKALRGHKTGKSH